jgi:RHS repeat-associated protein
LFRAAATDAAPEYGGAMMLGNIPIFSIDFTRHLSRRHWRILAAITFVASIASQQQALAGGSPPAMIVPGQFNVSGTGAAIYTIPIAVPPGSSGMVPALSLDYSSQSGDGIVGIGWSLSGLPSIGRCPRTLAEDGVHGGVNYDSGDRFCMEGQRLVAISGTYGATGTEYRTEIDGFTKVVSYGSSGSGPAYFKAWTKSGQIIEFGNTSDSRILAAGKTTARSWAANKISDTKGNYLTISYTNDNTNGQAYPSRIDYTGNTGVSPYNSVQFSYMTRLDVTPTYQVGSLQQTTVLLSHIKTYQGTNLVYDYQLSYRAGTSTTHSRLTSVALCDTNGACLAPTTFGWQGGTGMLAMTAAPSTRTQEMYAADYNGDGIIDARIGLGDIAGTGPYQAPVMADLGSNNGAFSWTQIGALSFAGVNCPAVNSCYIGRGPSIATIADILGNGLPSFVFDETYYHVQCNIPNVGCANVDIMWLAINNGSSSFATSTYGKITVGEKPYWVDFNGDGRSDFISSDGYRNIGNGDGTFSVDRSVSFSNATSKIPADFNGDGCTDVLTTGPNTHAITFSCSPVVATLNVPDWSSDQVVAADFNGDGKADVLDISSSGATLYLSTGTSVSSGYSIANSSDWYKYAVYVGDWNGDGKSDIALIAPGGACSSNCYGSGTSHKLYISTGVGFMPALDANNNPIAVSNSSYFANAYVADWNNDGAADFSLSSGYLYTFAHVPELMVSVSSGVGATTSVTYDRLNKNGNFYTKCPGSPGTYFCNDVYPVVGVDGPLYAVSQVAASNGVGGNYNSTYSYSGAKADRRGRGFLGFSSMTVTDGQTGVVQTTNYRTDFPYIGFVSSQTKAVNGVVLSSISNAYADAAQGTGTEGVTRHFVSLTQSVSSGHDLDGTALPTITTSYTYDSYGNALTVNTSVSDGSSKNATNTYSNDTTNWFLGRLTYTSVVSTVGSSSITRTSCFQYDSTSGLLTREVIEPVSSSNCTYSPTGVQTDYTYDSFGHRITSAVSGSGITTRSSSAGYDSLGQFQTSATNALSQSETWVYDARFGLPTSHTGPNGLTTSWSYDSFGRPILETRPDGNKTAVEYAYCSGVNGGTAYCVYRGAFTAVSTPQNSSGTQNGAPSVAYYDNLSRSVASDVRGYDGSWIRTTTQYDSCGRVAAQSRPYFATVPVSAAKWTNYTYDALGRVTQTGFPNGGYATFGYHGLTSSTTNDHSQTTTTVKNAQGLVASVTDALNHTTSYVYDAIGNLKTVTDPSGNVTTNTYDARGNKTVSSDPDMGSWSYGYDALGQLTSQTDAKSQTTTLAYDVLGRVTSRSETGLYSTWSYGTSSSSHNVGKLIEAKACTSSGCSSVVSDRTFTYDSLGRPSTMTLATGGATHTFTDTYNANGQLNTVAYPSGFAALYAYTSLGYLSQIKDNATGTAYWTANSRDAEMHLLSQTFGNGVSQTNSFDANTGFLTNIRAGTNNTVANYDYTYDTLGNLTYRADGYAGTFESACYDSLNRLTQYAVGNGVTACTSNQNAKAVGYDALGNITSKTDVGTYSYPSAGSIRPHAVSSIAGTVNGVVNPSYTYDANGNMTAGAGRTVTYTAFNMAASIVQGSTTVGFTYDSEHTRVQMTAPSGTTTYINDTGSGAMSEKLVSGSTTTWHDYIQADGKIIAEKFSGATSAMRYFVNDHLGSVAVVMNEAGTVVERNAFDAWGKRRNLNGSDDTTCSLTSQTTRGYTGHEQIDAACLINANARIYDPAIGRFMTADSIVPDAFDAQSYNRYAYVGNRPLSATDPTGHCAGILGCLNAFGAFGPLAPIAEPLIRHNPALGSVAVFAAQTVCSMWGPWAGAGCGAGMAAAVAGAHGAHTWTAFQIGARAFATSIAFYYLDKWHTTTYTDATKIETISGRYADAYSYEDVRHFRTDWVAVGVKTVAAGTIAGFSSEAAGGSFWDGFSLAAGLQFGAELYAAVVPYQSEMFGKSDDVAKSKDMVLGSDGKYHTIGPNRWAYCEPCNNNGVPRENYFNLIDQTSTVLPTYSMYEGSWLSRTLSRYFPWWEATAKFHDGFLAYAANAQGNVGEFASLASTVPSWMLSASAGLSGSASTALQFGRPSRRY